MPQRFDETQLDEAAKILVGWLAEAQHAVAFSGAGISTESGIPDFRSPNGVWANNRTVYFDEYLASEAGRYEFWRQKAQVHREFVAAKPNRAHLALANWEQAGRLRGVITQNIDGLHQLAGSREVLELHGTARFVACLNCNWRDTTDPWNERFLAEDKVPVCPNCQGLIKHATVSFGQSLPEGVLEQAIEWSGAADLFLSLGSSLVVHPAAGLPRFARERGGRLVIINRDPTPLDSIARIVINAPLGRLFEAIERAS